MSLLPWDDIFADHLATDIIVEQRHHRGNKLCRADDGNAASFICAYHGWAYSNDGSLQAVPNLKDAYYNELDATKWGLIPVSQLDSNKGLIFATFDATAPPLLEYLGEMTWYMDAFFDRREGGVEVIGGTHKWVIPSNWKFAAENFAGDAYHSGWSHLSAITTGFGANHPQQSNTGGGMLSPGNGHCIVGLGPDVVPDPPVPEILDYERSIMAEVKQRLGPRRDLINPIGGTVFPNHPIETSVVRFIRVLHPRGPGHTEVWSWQFVDRAAPPEVKDAFRVVGLRNFGPAGVFEQDDMDNWQECTETCRGVVTRRFDLNFQMGLEHEHFDERLAAWVSDFGISESNHRQFYGMWARMMAGNGWNGV